MTSLSIDEQTPTATTHSTSKPDSEPTSEPAHEPGIESAGAATDRLRHAARKAARKATSVAAAPLAVYAASTGLHLAALRAQLPGQRGIRAALTSWDGNAFLQIAQHGYPHHITWGHGPALIGSRAAFFPAYPATIRAVHLLGQPLGLSWDRAAITAALLASATAAILLYQLGTDLHSRTAGLALVTLIFAQPLSIVFTMAYSEGLFLALAAGTLLALRHHRWLTAGGLCFAAGLTRPPGLAVAAAVVIAAPVWLWRHPRTAGAAGRWRPIIAALAAATAVPAWWLYIGLRLGRLDAWFAIQQQAWSTHFDGGHATATVLTGLFTHPITWTDLGMILLLLLGILMTVTVITERVWLPLAVYGLTVIAMTLGADGIVGVKARYLAVAIALFIPAAIGLTKTRRTTATAVLSAYTLVGVWYGTHVLAVGGLTV